MTKLPRISGRECVTALLKFGFQVKRQHGSHIILRREEPFAQAVVPDHSELDTGTLRSILRQGQTNCWKFSNCASFYQRN